MKRFIFTLIMMLFCTAPSITAATKKEHYIKPPDPPSPPLQGGYMETRSLEGGYCFIKGDRGGETYAGISRNAHPGWKGWKTIDSLKCISPLKHRQHITSLETNVDQFYRKIWEDKGFEKIKDHNLAIVIYDTYFHHHKNYKKIMKRCMDKMASNMDFSKHAIDHTSINNADPSLLIKLVLEEREKIYLNLSKKNNQRKFLKGWLSRISKLKQKTGNIPAL